MATKVKKQEAAPRYPLPATVDSPRDRWKLDRVLYDGGPGRWSAAEGLWEGAPRVALRWNGGGDTQSEIGNPQSRGLPTWFIVPEEIEDAVREGIVAVAGEGREPIGGRPQMSLKDEMLAIGKRCAALPDRDTRSDEEILGFDERGLPR